MAHIMTEDYRNSVEEPEGVVDRGSSGWDSSRRSEEFSRLAVPHIPALRRYLYVMHRGNYHDAEDILQEGLIKAMNRLDGFQGRSDFRTWLFQICRNQALDGFRRRKRELGRIVTTAFDAVDSTAPVMEIPADDDSDPESRFLDAEKRRAVGDALLQLPVKFREPLMLKEMEGLSIAETAGILGLPEGTVKSRLFSARRRLTTIFNRIYGGENE